MLRLLLATACGWLFAATVALAADPPAADPAAPKADAAKAEEPSSREELEKKFAADLSGATLVGHFTVDGKNGSPKEERYTLTKVAKDKDDYWWIASRIVYGDHDVTVPLHLEVKWAGDTPVITLTDLSVPGLGTYTARVLIYRGQYAGTWSGGTHGGQLFGKIEKAPAGNGPKTN